MHTTQLQVRKDQLSTTRLHTLPDQALADGQVRVCIDHFALTSNNITYAAFGDAMGYWQFFPTAEEGWGNIPVWGFASVVQSLHPGVAVGERLYGYWPMATGTVLQPDRLSAERFTDATTHRAALPAVYNQYFRCAADPLYSANTEDIQALLRPLFITSWLIDDFMADSEPIPFGVLMVVQVPVGTFFQALAWWSTLDEPAQVVPGPAAQSFLPAIETP